MPPKIEDDIVLNLQFTGALLARTELTVELSLWLGSVVGLVLFLVMLASFACALHAILSSRTPQGSIAWLIALLSVPLLAVPAYLVLGRRRFHGLVNARAANSDWLETVRQEVRPKAQPFTHTMPAGHADYRVFSELTHLPFIKGNQVELLIDGEATFAAMFQAIDLAQEYVLAEFFIVKDDQLGREFQAALISAARRGCQVYLLYDEVGSQHITRAYLQELRAAGVQVTGMKSTQGWRNRFQLNFRNHRKIVVIDGQVCLIGGLNVGDEYIHRSQRLTPWRDTHLKISGPATLAAQLTFVEDYHWATGQLPQVHWQVPQTAAEDLPVFILPSGPADDFETCGMFFTHLINSAQKRLWISSPYFVPDEGIVMALQLAAMRGVDVRILIPGLPDKWLVKRAAMAYVAEVTQPGVRMFEYGEGFLHQKALLVDDDVALVGTANFDNRSFRLNFEISVLVISASFNQQVADMLTRDFERSREIDPQELAQRGIWFEVTSRVARLFSPVL